MTGQTRRVAHVPGQMLLPLNVPDLTDEQRAELAAHVAPDWQAMAECRSIALTGNGDQHYPDWDDTEATEAALDSCRWCPVRRSCLAYALSEFNHDDDYGIWGGTTEGRRDLVRQALGEGVAVRTVLDLTIGQTSDPAPLTEAEWRRTA